MELKRFCTDRFREYTDYIIENGVSSRENDI